MKPQETSACSSLLGCGGFFSRRFRLAENTACEPRSKVTSFVGLKRDRRTPREMLLRLSSWNGTIPNKVALSRPCRSVLLGVQISFFWADAIFESVFVCWLQVQSKLSGNIGVYQMRISYCSFCLDGRPMVFGWALWGVRRMDELFLDLSWVWICLYISAHLPLRSVGGWYCVSSINVFTCAVTRKERKRRKSFSESSEFVWSIDL